MVPQAADGVEFDFQRESITPVIEDGWVTTGNRTTLGADDGAGVALAMELRCLQKLQKALQELISTNMQLILQIKSLLKERKMKICITNVKMFSKTLLAKFGNLQTPLFPPAIRQDLKALPTN